MVPGSLKRLWLTVILLTTLSMVLSSLSPLVAAESQTMGQTDTGQEQTHGTTSGPSGGPPQEHQTCDHRQKVGCSGEERPWEQPKEHIAIPVQEHEPCDHRQKVGCSGGGGSGGSGGTGGGVKPPGGKPGKGQGECLAAAPWKDEKGEAQGGDACLHEVDHVETDQVGVIQVGTGHGEVIQLGTGQAGSAGNGTPQSGGPNQGVGQQPPAQEPAERAEATYQGQDWSIEDERLSEALRERKKIESEELQVIQLLPRTGRGVETVLPASAVGLLVMATLLAGLALVWGSRARYRAAVGGAGERGAAGGAGRSGSDPTRPPLGGRHWSARGRGRPPVR